MHLVGHESYLNMHSTFAMLCPMLRWRVSHQTLACAQVVNSHLVSRFDSLATGLSTFDSYSRRLGLRVARRPVSICRSRVECLAQ